MGIDRDFETWTASSWISVEERLPDHGKHVLIRRSNGVVDRAEISALYFDGLPAWLLPEGPTFTDDGSVIEWMEIPE